jgi:hypothetical protein
LRAFNRSVSAQWLMDAARGISPIVVDLTAEQVTADAPHVLELAETVQIFTADEHVVDVLHLERKMIEAGALVPHAEEGVVINLIVAGIDPAELANDVLPLPGINVV